MPQHSAQHRLFTFRITKRQKQKFIRRSALAFAVIEPAMTLPQVYEIWAKHHAEGVSSITWGLYIVAAFVWLSYGLQLRDKPLIISSTLWIFTEAAVVLGTIIYS